MIWIKLFCGVVLVIVITYGIVYTKRCGEEWEQVFSWPEYKTIYVACYILSKKPAFDVGTYSKFQNVRSSNIHKYVNCAQIDTLIKERIAARTDVTKALGTLTQLAADAKYPITKRKLNRLINRYKSVYNNTLTVIITYRTPVKLDVKQRVLYIREDEWKVQSESLQQKESRQRTFAQEQRNRITKKVRFAVLQRDNFTCQYCGAHGPGVVLEVDHIIPISKGGTSDMDNLITACFDCNRGKGDATLDSTDRDSTHDAPLQTRE